VSGKSGCGKIFAHTVLEFHHRVPYALGGEATAANITLACRSHDAHLAAQDFGPWAGKRTEALRTDRSTRSGTSSRGGELKPELQQTRQLD
jgi:hypothetical protein